jgi:hypothetical protein
MDISPRGSGTLELGQVSPDFIFRLPTSQATSARSSIPISRVRLRKHTRTAPWSLLEKRQIRLRQLRSPFVVDSFADGRPHPKPPDPSANPVSSRSLDNGSLKVKTELDEIRI